MPKKQVPLQQLEDYLPDNCCDEVLHYLNLYKVHLTVTRQRQTILGDYRNAYKEKNHRISVNGNLNKYSFLITLLHELAHLLTYDKYQHKVQPHGKEWKIFFGNLLNTFIQKNIFPSDVETTLKRTLTNPSASSCGDSNLLRVLRNYDQRIEGYFLVEELEIGKSFIIKDGRVFTKGEKIRTRYKCKETATRKEYLFSGLYEVKLIS